MTGRPTHAIYEDGAIVSIVFPDGYDPAEVDIRELPTDWWAEHDENQAWGDLRAERDRRLAACDWTQMRDQGESVAALWAPYRQALRDLPAATVDPAAPDWPEKPA